MSCAARCTASAHETFSGRWAHHVSSHPKRYAGASLAVLVALAIPVASMRIGQADDGNAAQNTTQRKAYDLLADGFGKGFNGPIQVVVDVPTNLSKAQEDLLRELAAHRDEPVAPADTSFFARIKSAFK